MQKISFKNLNVIFNKIMSLEGIIKRWNILIRVCKLGITMPKMTSHGDVQHLPNITLQMGLGSV